MLSGNIVLIVADSLRRDTFNQLTTMDGFKDYPAKLLNVDAMNSCTELSLPWMLSGMDTYSPTMNIATDLRRLGYNSLMIHSNPIVDRFRHGFDTVIDLHTHSRKARLSRRFNRVRDALQKRLPASTYNHVKGMIRGNSGYLPYCRVKEKLEAIQTYTPDPPYFIWLHLMDPHTPYYPRTAHLDAEKIIDLNNNQISAVRGYYKPNMEEVKTWYSLYLQESEEMWRTLNKYLETLDYGETTVIFTSDHGEEFGEHGHYGHKGNRFNPENISVPFFIAGDMPRFSIKDHSQLRAFITGLYFE